MTIDAELKYITFGTTASLVRVAVLFVFLQKHQHPIEENHDLYYWAEITGQHIQTFNIITDTILYYWAEITGQHTQTFNIITDTILYYWAEITGQHTQTFNIITDTILHYWAGITGTTYKNILHKIKQITTTTPIHMINSSSWRICSTSLILHVSTFLRITSVTGWQKFRNDIHCAGAAWAHLTKHLYIIDAQSSQMDFPVN